VAVIVAEVNGGGGSGGSSVLAVAAAEEEGWALVCPDLLGGDEYALMAR